MADFSGIEAVTSTLRELLIQRSHDLPTVTVAPPDVDVPDTDPPLANLFLYRVSSNAALANQQLDARAGPASLGPPPLSLDLHYLLTASGISTHDDRGAHRVLGDAMLTLHDHPLVPKDDPLLDPSLSNEVELLKITLESLDVEELSKIWTATTAPYRVGVGFRVTVVQLESTRPRRVARPVLEPPDAGPRVQVVALNRPRIERVAVIRRLPDGTDGPEQPVPYARVGERLVIHGDRLHPSTRVLLGGVDATGGIQAGSTTRRLVVAVPDDEALTAGLHGVQVARDVTIGEPPDERSVPLQRSGLAAFVLVPAVTGIAPAAGPDPTTVTIQGQRLVRPGAATTVLIGSEARSPLGDPEPTPTELQVTIAGLAHGTYPVAVRVGGADSIDPITFEVTA